MVEGARTFHVIRVRDLMTVVRDGAACGHDLRVLGVAWRNAMQVLGRLPRLVQLETGRAVVSERAGLVSWALLFVAKGMARRGVLELELAARS